MTFCPKACICCCKNLRHLDNPSLLPLGRARQLRELVRRRLLQLRKGQLHLLNNFSYNVLCHNLGACNTLLSLRRLLSQLFNTISTAAAAAR